MYSQRHQDSLQKQSVAFVHYFAICALACFLSVRPVTAVAVPSAASYGEEIVRAGQEWPDGRPRGGALGADEDPAALVAPAVTDEAEYLQQVEALELSAGPYAESLAEPLAGLARYERSSGDLQAAHRLYQRALHIVRVNEGLNSNRQLPLVRELLDTYRLAGEMEKLDERYDYFFRLYGQGQPPFTVMRLRAAVEYLRWQREALRSDLGEGDNRRLLELYNLNEEILSATEFDNQVGYAWYRELVLSQLRNLYLVQARIAPRIDEVGLVRYNPLVSPNTGMLGQENFEETRLEAIQRSAVSRGAALLESLVDRAAAEGAVALAAARLELADWYQWNGLVRRATPNYAAVAAGLRAGGEGKLLDYWLGQPLELPANGAFWQPRSLGEGERRVTVKARYDVTANGQARNITALVDRESDEPAARRLRRELSKTRFRPRFLHGIGEAVNKVEAEYELID